MKRKPTPPNRTDILQMLQASYHGSLGLNCHAFVDRFKSYFAMRWRDQIDCYIQVLNFSDQDNKKQVVVSYFHNQSQTEYRYYILMEEISNSTA